MAGQVAQENGRPNSVEYRVGAARGGDGENFTPLLARGSARSVNQVDLYQLVKDQASVASLWRASLAAGLSLPDIPLFTEAINRRGNLWVVA